MEMTIDLVEDLSVTVYSGVSKSVIHCLTQKHDLETTDESIPLKTANVDTDLPLKQIHSTHPLLSKYAMAEENVQVSTKNSHILTDKDKIYRSKIKLNRLPLFRMDQSSVRSEATLDDGQDAAEKVHRSLDIEFDWVLSVETKDACLLILLSGLMKTLDDSEGAKLCYEITFQKELFRNKKTSAANWLLLEGLYGVSSSSVVSLDNHPHENSTPQCVVCLTDPASICILPCKHFCVCNECWLGVEIADRIHCNESSAQIGPSQAALNNHNENSSWFNSRPTIKMTACPVCRGRVDAWLENGFYP